MTEQDSKDKYIKCSRCKCKYINDDDHIKTDFGYNRLNERYKTCVTCRDKHKAYVDKRKQTMAEERMAERKIAEKMAERKIAVQRIAEQKRPVLYGDGSQRCTRCRNVRHVKEYGEYVDRVYLDGTKHWTPYKTCSSCRNRDKRRV